MLVLYRRLIVLRARLRRVVDGWVAGYLRRCQIEGMSAVRRHATIQNGGAILDGAAMLYRFDADLGT
jgi:hypothetical protein